PKRILGGKCKAETSLTSKRPAIYGLGRAFGRRADQSSPFTAPAYAAKARQNFEKALELNPRNIEAMNDLFEYYLEAPGFLGGGLDKAALLANRIAALDPVEAHYAQYRLAEKKGDSVTARASGSFPWRRKFSRMRRKCCLSGLTRISADAVI